MTAKQASREIPTDQKGPKHVATIMFIDIVGCSTISSILGVTRYGKFLKRFKDIAIRCIEDILQDNYRTKAHTVRKHLPKYLRSNVRGDEACVILFSDYNKKTRRDKELARTRDANTAIEIALQIKQDWLGSPYNKKQLSEGKLPCELAIGINSGPVEVSEVWTKSGTELRPEGYAINLAKRVESESRRGRYSGILVGQLTKSLYDSDVGESEAFFGEVTMADLKGITQLVPTYEIKYFTLPTNWREFRRKRASFLSRRPEEEAKKARALRPWTLKALKANRSSAWLATVYGNQSLAVEQYKRAEAVFLELRKAHPQDPEPRCLLGNVYGEQGEYKDEKECYKEAIELNPYVPEWHYYLGLCLSYILERKEDKLAKKDKKELTAEVQKILGYFREAIYLNPQFSWAYYDKACVLNHYGRMLDHKAWMGQAQPALDNAMEMDEECETVAREPTEEWLEGLRLRRPRRRAASKKR